MYKYVYISNNIRIMCTCAFWALAPRTPPLQTSARAPAQKNSKRVFRLCARKSCLRFCGPFARPCEFLPCHVCRNLGREPCRLEYIHVQCEREREREIHRYIRLDIYRESTGWATSSFPPSQTTNRSPNNPPLLRSACEKTRFQDVGTIIQMAPKSDIRHQSSNIWHQKKENKFCTTKNLLL